VGCGEGPFDAFEIQAALDVLVFGYVVIVVVVEELIVTQRLKGDKRG
jgi:hypothetical protein